MTAPHQHKPPTGRAYLGALIALLLLTGFSFGFSFAHFETAGPIVALVIAAIKVTIVATVFMELSKSVAATRVVGVVMVLWVAILCMGVFADVGFR